MSKMPPTPEALKRNGRPLVPEFHPEEYLFRRVPTRLWNAATEELTVAAVELPDISTARSLLGHPEWLRLDLHKGIYRKNWGVIGVQIARILPSFQPEGGPVFLYRIVHVPLENDYPHSEIQAFADDVHLNTDELLSEAQHLEWRANLLQACQTIIRPHEERSIRPDPPQSFHLEPHPDRKNAGGF